MAFISVGSRGLEAVRDRLKAYGDKADTAIRKGVAETALAIQAKAKRNLTDDGTVDTGSLRQRIIVRFWKDGRAATVEAATAYAEAVEYGAKFSKMPPSSALDAWARRHGLPNGFVVARAIQRRGFLKPRPFLIPAWREESARLVERIEARLKREQG